MIEHHINLAKTKIDQLPLTILGKASRGELVDKEVKGYVVEEREALLAAELGLKNFKGLNVKANSVNLENYKEFYKRFVKN